MNKNLELLVELQKMDDEVMRLDALLETLPAEIEQSSDSFKSAKNEHERFINEVKEKNKLRLDKEREVEEKIAGMAKAKTKLPGVKTNEEYKAVLAEIDNMKNGVTRLEDEQINLMEELDGSKEQEKRLKKVVEEEGKKFTNIKTEKEADIEKLRKEKEESEKNRNEFAEQIDQQHLAHYAKIFFAREKKAVVKLLGEEKEGFCSACHQKVIPQIAVEIRTGDQIHTCQHCSRFLYSPNSKKAQNNSVKAGGQVVAGMQSVPEESPDTTERGTP